jgi:toxin ParE1/3/4
MQLRISRAARDDVIGIWKFIAEGNPSRADTFLDERYSTFRLLAANPAVGRRRDELRTGVRSFAKGKYVVFYSRPEDSKELEIARVLSGYCDLDELFEG